MGESTGDGASGLEVERADGENGRGLSHAMVVSRDQAVGGESGDSALDPRDWPGNNLPATGSMGRPGNRHVGVGEAPEPRGVPDGGEAGGARGVESRAAERSPGATGV